MVRITAELRNWEFDRMTNRYVGDIYSDGKFRWADGRRILTSYVKYIYDHGDYYLVVTLNSLYKLNKNQKKLKTYENKIRNGSVYLRRPS